MYSPLSPKTLSLDSIIIATPGQVSADLGGDTVILQVTSGIYYSLNNTGARIWCLAQEPISAQQICETLVAEYDVEFTVCVQAVMSLLAQLVEHGLVEIAQKIMA